jgi:hypothetical protein
MTRFTPSGGLANDFTSLTAAFERDSSALFASSNTG